MNILHINNTDLAGGRFNGYYMKQSLDKSFNVEMVVWNKKSQNSNVHQSPPDHPVLRFFALNIERIGVRLGFDGLTGIIGWILPFQDYFKRADIIHLHQIHNHPNFSILSLPMLTRKKPVIWTIHDPWADEKEVMREYDLTSLKTLPNKKFDAIILTVSHSKFKGLDFHSLKNDNAIVYDVKNFIKKGFVDGNL
jgi:glycosyltransferase involved in cell wall biosynthesis